MNIRKRAPADNPVLVEIWLRSARATHTFLREQDIEDLYPQARDTYLPSVDVWVCEDADCYITGFIGMHEAQIVHAFYRRYGFEDAGRSPTDSAGRPFPLVHMALRH